MDAVLQVLAGATVREVARDHDVDVALLHRWVRDFIDAGSAQVTNTPREGDAQQRDRFLAAFAHELRTPLAVAEGWASLLADGDVPPGMAQDATAKLVEALTRLGKTVEEVELLASASLGRLVPTFTQVTVADLLHHVRGPDRAEGAGNDVTLYVDVELFAHVIGDIWAAALIDPAPHRVRLSVEETHNAVELSVIREGAPIDHRRLQALFDPFTVNDDATGVTIGLYLARALTVLHAGTLGVNQQDQTTTFWVKLPRFVQDDDGTKTDPEE